MNACASLAPAAPDGAVDAIEPVVLIDAAPQPRLVVESLDVRGPLDERAVTLRALDDRGWVDRRAVIAIPIGQIDDTTRWIVLAKGELRGSARRVEAGRNERTLELVDDWAARLAAPLDAIWWINVDGAPIEQSIGVMRAGPAGNRSIDTHVIDNQPIHVLQTAGQPWTVAVALATLSALHGLKLALPLLPQHVARAQLVRDVDLTRPVGEALRRIVEPYGLFVQRDLVRDGNTLIERHAVRHIEHARAVRLRWARDNQPIGEVLQVVANRPADAAQPWLARGAGWRIESTFEMTAGWDAALEGQPDAQYDRALSTDFQTYANVYRRWVLNEDANFAGPAFDIGAFFGVDPERPQPLRFLPCVTLDDTGQPRPPIVEFSTDSGSSWSSWPDSVNITTTRAAVYFGDAALPAAFLVAAKAGTAKVRVTAGLQSPRPVEVLRWRGNPFAGTLPARTFELADTFAFRRVDEQSIHHDDVRAGVLQADEIDQSNELIGWLVERVRRTEAPLGSATLALSGVHPALRIGDRLIDTTGPGKDARGDAEAIARRGAIVHRITHRFAANRRGPDTTVELRF